jgi:hypothetical protein
VLKNAVTNSHVTIDLHTLGINTGATTLYLFFQILAPAAQAEGMTALVQAEPIRRRNGIIADHA